MKIFLVVLACLALVFAALAVWVRIAPVDTARLHVAPRNADDPGESGVRRIGPDAPRFDASPDRVLSALASVAEQRERVRLLAQGDGLVTFEARTKWMRFPDYLTFQALPDSGGTRLEVISRSRFGSSDLGVNAKRLESWLAALNRALADG